MLSGNRLHGYGFKHDMLISILSTQVDEPIDPHASSTDEKAEDKKDDFEPKTDDQDLKEGINAQDKNEPKEDDSARNVDEISPHEDSAPKDGDVTPKNSMLDVDSPPSSKEPKDNNKSGIDLPERPKPENEGVGPSQSSEEPSQGSEGVPKDSLLDGVDPSIIDKAEEKRNVEPSHPEAQESPEQDPTPPVKGSNAPKGSLLDGAEPSRAKEADKYEHPEAPSHEEQRASEGTQPSQTIPAEEEFDDASGPQPSSDYEEVMEDTDDKDSKYGDFLQPYVIHE
jgi:hypothetical protein